MLNRTYASAQFLTGQIRSALDFYFPRCVDPAGGFIHQFDEDGRATDTRRRSLIMSCRYVFVHATGWSLFGDAAYREAVEHGVKFLTEHHHVPETGGYLNVVSFDAGKATHVDDDNVTYGLIFCVLAYAMAIKAGHKQSGKWLEKIVQTLEDRVFEPQHGLYADQHNADWSQRLGYRGQNANMHACEAMLAAYEATHDGWYLKRAGQLAEAITGRLATLSPDGMVWEHYHPDWSPDWAYNEDVHSEPQRPFGYLSGHQTEWAKLLVILNRYDPDPAHIERASKLFDLAFSWAWDENNKGMYYSRRPGGGIYDDDKHQWTLAESVAAAGLLHAETGEARFARWHDRLWDYIAAHFVDAGRGGWYRMLDVGNRHVGAGRGEPEPDYHNIGACAELLRTLHPGVGAGK